MHALANVNGETMPLAEARVPVLDRGFLFGDAVYEVLRVYRGRPWLLDAHFARLGRGLEALRIQGVNLSRLKERMLATIAAGKFQEAVAYVHITRGAAPRKHAFPLNAVPFELLYVQEFNDPYTELRRTGATVITRPDIRWDRCDIKSTNLLGNVLAMQAATEAGAVEALLYLPDGTLTEGAHTSFFAVHDGVLLTRPNSSAILPGTTRDLVLRLAAEVGLPAREQALNRAELPLVSDLFLTGTTSEVLPIIRVDEQTIADGRPGSATRKLQEAFVRAVGAG
ncbi:MAG: aminotransferase IV [Planctomycetes bacterium]|nr:aminotransferase IV [Planctomycetota bacterium]